MVGDCKHDFFVPFFFLDKEHGGGRELGSQVFGCGGLCVCGGLRDSPYYGYSTGRALYVERTIRDAFG